MFRRALAWGLVCGGLLGSCPGCLIMHASEKVVRQEEKREPVQFESDFARRSFQKRALDDDSRREAGGKLAFGIPFLAGIARSTVVSKNAWYNDQILTCDMDGDRLITDEEVLAFGAVEDKQATEPDSEIQVASDTEPVAVDLK